MYVFVLLELNLTNNFTSHFDLKAENFFAHFFANLVKFLITETF